MNQQIDDLKLRASNAVYAALIGIYEEAEASGLIFGNGHHMAQMMATSAAELLQHRHNKATRRTSASNSGQ